MISERELIAQDLVARFNQLRIVTEDAEYLGLEVRWGNFDNVEVHSNRHWPESANREVKRIDEEDLDFVEERDDPAGERREAIATRIIELGQVIASLLQKAEELDLEVEWVHTASFSMESYLYIRSYTYWPKSTQREYERDREAFNAKFDEEWAYESTVLVSKKPRPL